jgi:hypothetical protein
MAQRIQKSVTRSHHVFLLLLKAWFSGAACECGQVKRHSLVTTACHSCPWQFELDSKVTAKTECSISLLVQLRQLAVETPNRIWESCAQSPSDLNLSTAFHAHCLATRNYNMYVAKGHANAFSAASKRPSTANAHHTSIHSPCQHKRAASVTCSAPSCISSTAYTPTHRSIQTAAAVAGSPRAQGVQGLHRNSSSTFQHLQMHQQYQGHRFAPTYVCRVLTESADMTVGSKAPDFEVGGC